MRTKFFESNIEEDFDIKIIILLKNLPDPISISEVGSKNYVDGKLKDPGIIKNTAQVGFNDETFDDVHFVGVNFMPAVSEHLTAKYYVDEAISNSVDEQKLLRLDPNEEINIDEQDSVNLISTLTSPKAKVERPSKSNVDSLHEKKIEKDEIFQQYLLIKMTNLIKIN